MYNKLFFSILSTSSEKGGSQLKNIVQLHTPEHVQIPFETAGIGTRGMAKLIDLLCILFLFIPIQFIFGLLSMVPLIDSIFIAIYIILSALVPLTYFVGLEMFMKGQTIGKKVMGVRVIMENGQTPTFLAVFLRNVLQLADLFPVMYLTGIITMFFNKKEKRLGDLVAGTMVVLEKKEKSDEIILTQVVQVKNEEKEILKQLPILPGNHYLLLENFLTRRNSFTSETRQQIAAEMVKRVWPEIETSPGYEEFFLEKVYLYLRHTYYPSQFPKLSSSYRAYQIEKEPQSA
ncbi:RDD family protein [Hazenella coriacea]|uniref:Putative RDD family membrane protein YckC n=1 Tax=Hazenella coriacea TaxID=1179467 RepID=A0A4R3L6R0_9BACL|nr:RDD family protein [Hazenella coriacea]TCS93894.1 putative RDD family membrane protein YckC [Hazenella coriacea]